MSDKKKEQLGMNHSTARNRLVTDILWNFVCTSNMNVCYRCGKPMTRETFSIDHKEPWIDSDNPVERFFDLANISYSHLLCNIKDGRRGNRTVCGQGTQRYNLDGCRCSLCKAAKAAERARTYTKEKRSAQYKRTGT